MSRAPRDSAYLRLSYTLHRKQTESFIAALKARAKANHRSLEGELRHLLSRYAVPDSNLGLVRERARAAYGPAAPAQNVTPDPTDPPPDAKAERVEWLGAMRDVTAIKGDIISPVSELSDWDVYRSDATSGEESDEEGGEGP